ncbi:isochorismatase family protein [Paramicrobacterium agarici]|uniref:nicotinamidase n=1 Tax=Paramicrobacterium agarici TaxID=630514 RepID=A0A2A9DWM3_9MICO|nr:isochorismatase family protein [Microbacterium agarici]PFG30751.1 nicotinamidase/pyrazinamidase [Microbacterium agarici]TQO23754.1 nicotinamidase/pyrazinamidase [Microbacterium agarici]
MTRALLIVDVQNDFTEGGALGVFGGADVARNVTRWLNLAAKRYGTVVASRDWHNAADDNGGHFASDGDAPDYVSTWPVHCVADTPGAEYHPAFDTARVSTHVRKGQGVPAYSAFEGTTDDGRTLLETLSEAGVTEIDAVGIATDHCVRASVLDAVDAGMHVTVLTDLIAGVAAESSEAALAEMAVHGVTLAKSSEVPTE